MDYLPAYVVHSIYYKHQLEFKPTLHVISKLRIAIDSEIVETRIPIKKLLETTTSRTRIYIDVRPFGTTNTDNRSYQIQKEFNTSEIQVHNGLGSFCDSEIKLKDKVQLIIVSILHIIYQLGLSTRINKVLVNIKFDDIHHKTSCITFKNGVIQF